MPGPTRSCPGCGQPMRPIETRGPNFDSCRSCGGLWFEAGALDARGAKLPPDAAEIGLGNRACPDCGTALRVVTSSVVELDRCPECRGIYLDPGELELLLQVRGAAEGGATFRCDFCHALHPLSEQVIGELATACAACAERLGVHPDPRGRRRRELERRKVRLDMSGKIRGGALDEILSFLNWWR